MMNKLRLEALHGLTHGLAQSIIDHLNIGFVATLTLFLRENNVEGSGAFELLAVFRLYPVALLVVGDPIPLPFSSVVEPAKTKRRAAFPTSEIV